MAPLKNTKTTRHVRKRDGSVVKFDDHKIKEAMKKAFVAVREPYTELDDLTIHVVNNVNTKFAKITPTVEDVSDIIEAVLMEDGYHEVARAFILYREYRKKLRGVQKAVVGSGEKTNLSVNAIRILESRYLLKDPNGNVNETPNQLFSRIAKAIAAVETKYSKKKDASEEVAKKFYDMMYTLDFMPNSPTLMNAGTPAGQLSACFVLPVGDSLIDIFDGIKYTAIIHQSGGGTGFSFSRLRPKGCIVKSSMGVSSGPISFMGVYNKATDVIKQGGKRRGANMGILRVDHPDIIEFITCKQREGDMSNFNLSVALTDSFMKSLESDSDYDLIDPRHQEPSGKMNAKSVFDLITNMAWTNGEPGIIFIDEINRYNYVPNMGQIEATNPCGEQPLLPYESCNLGSINLANMVDSEGKIDWKKLKETVEWSVRFLDNVIDANNYPLAQIDKVTKSSRKIGLGVMGWADMLLQLKISYCSDDAVYLAEKLMKFITDAGVEASVALAEKRGSFPAFKGSKWEQSGFDKMRNATVTTIAPTGTISMIADASSGIEPLFSIAYTKIALDEKEFVYVNKYFEREAKTRGFYTDELMYKIAKEGSVQNIPEIPEDIKRVFVTTHDIDTEWHIKMQAAFQKYTHNAVSKTINMPHSATIDDVKKAYLESYKLGCKGITVYREGSRQLEVLKRGVKDKKSEDDSEEKQKSVQKTIVQKKASDLCPVCKSKMHALEGCYTCPSCGYSKCSV